jgi:phosphoribosylformylglycinamidine synthase
LGQSLYAREIHKVEAGDAPHVDLAAERKHGEFIRDAIEDGTITACHDVSDGGLAVTLAEMAMASGIGCAIDHVGDAAFWFGEDQARYVVTTRDAKAFMDKAVKAGVPALAIGKTGGVVVALNDASVEIAELVAVNESWLPGFMA